MDDREAHRIFQDWLDRVVVHVVDDDHAAWRRTMSCPLVVDSATGPSAMATEDQLRAKFDEWRRLIATHDLTDLIRTAHDVRAVARDGIEGAYTFDILSHGAPVIPRFISGATLKFREGHWRATHLHSGLAERYRHLIHTTAADGDPVAQPISTPEGNIR